MVKRKNYTPIGDLIKKLQTAHISVPKESEPIFTSKKEDVDRIIIHENNEEHEIPEEVKPFVKPSSETVTIPPDLKKFGLVPISSSNSSIFQSVKLPISDDKVIQGLHEPVTSSWRWLAELSLFLLRQAHLALRTIHGHVVRVV
ncbi:MAG: hypothetical protein QW404_03780, partial [Candidatus Nanoarchaeia archaeon]